MKWICKFFYEKLLGWKTNGQFPELKQYVVIVAPHTSWHDFYMGILIRCVRSVRVNFVAKKSFSYFLSVGFFVFWEGCLSTGLKARIPLPIRLRYLNGTPISNWLSHRKAHGKRSVGGRPVFITLPKWPKSPSSWLRSITAKKNIAFPNLSILRAMKP